MALAFDAASGEALASGTTLTLSHTCGSGANRLLIVNVLVVVGTDELTGVTYAGVAMTLVQKLINFSGTGFSIYQFCLPNPASGANNIVVTCGTSQPIRCSAESLTGAKQTTTLDNFGSFSNTGTTSLLKAITPVADKCWLVGCIKTGTGTFTLNGGTTQRSTGTSHIESVDSNGAITPPASTSLGLSWGTGADYAAILVASVAPAVSAGNMLEVF